MENIGIYSTVELVKELIMRDGVESIGVDVEDKSSIVVDNKFGARVYSSTRQQGPEIIIRVID